MKNLIILCLFFFVSSAFSQKKVEFKISEKNNSLFFTGVNKSNLNQQVVLFFKEIEGLEGYTKPVQKIIPANGKVQFLKLSFLGKYSYNYSYTVEPKPTDEQKLNQKDKLYSFEFTEGKPLGEGIVVFSKDGCSRCKITTDYLTKNKVAFQNINISENRKSNSLMWEVIKVNGKNLKSVPTPVILVDGELHYEFKNLRKFLKKLKNYKRS